MIMEKYLLGIVIYTIIYNVQSVSNAQEDELVEYETERLFSRRDQLCPDEKMCKSKYDFCGFGSKYCGKDCKAGPCTGSNRKKSKLKSKPKRPKESKPKPKPPEKPKPKPKLPGIPKPKPKLPEKGKPKPKDGKNVINDNNFRCAFPNLNDGTRRQRLDGLEKSGWKPKNVDEAAVFLAHVYHETDGLKTLKEYCAPGCGPNYVQSWCDVKAVPGKLYFGRGWFQLSYPCNYNAAGKSLGLDLLNNPDWVSEKQDVAVKTAIWFYQTNKMDGPAQKGDFAATTRIINGKVECNGGAGATNQKKRVESYKQIRKCFGLGEPKINPTC